MDPLDDVIGYGEFGYLKMIDNVAGGEAEEVVATLEIPCGVESKGANGAWDHGIVMFLMGLGCTHQTGSNSGGSSRLFGR